jgi:hypothetical protein
VSFSMRYVAENDEEGTKTGDKDMNGQLPQIFE